MTRMQQYMIVLIWHWLALLKIHTTGNQTADHHVLVFVTVFKRHIWTALKSNHLRVSWPSRTPCKPETGKIGHWRKWLYLEYILSLHDGKIYENKCNWKITTIYVWLSKYHLLIVLPLEPSRQSSASSYGPSSTAQSTALSAPGCALDLQECCWAAGGQSPRCRPPWLPHRWSGRSHTARCPAAFYLYNPCQSQRGQFTSDS